MFKPAEKQSAGAAPAGKSRAASAPNRTGIPMPVKSYFEAASGFSFDDVRVHYNSGAPKRVDALAYTQGNQVYLGPGQERHLPHELGHVVQQKRGMVRPTGRVAGLALNDDPKLERMADRMSAFSFHTSAASPGVVQRVPNLAAVALTRFNEITTPQGIQAALQNGIGAYFLSAGLPPPLATAIMAAFNQQAIPANGFAAWTLPWLIRNYYDTNAAQPNQAARLQHNLGADRGQIDPNDPTIPAARRQLLGQLQQALNQTLLIRVQRSQRAGTNARAGVAPRAAAGGVTQIPLGINGAGIQFLRWRQGTGDATLDNQQDIVEGIARFNALIQPALPMGIPTLPLVPVETIPFGGQTSPPSAVNPNGAMYFGYAVGPSQAAHEAGHHLENHLGVSDLVTMHNFLRARTDPNAPQGQRGAGWGLFGRDPMGTYGPGYAAELPPMVFQNDVSRFMSSGNGLLRFGLFNGGNWALSGISRMAGHPERGQRFVDDFFLQESNSEATSYATMLHGAGSEFLSTTAELLSTERGARELIRTDPLRAAMFVRIGNRRLYGGLNHLFQAAQAGGPPVNLDDLLHVV